MANFLDKIRIKTAVGRTNKFDLSCDHVTTQEFFNLRPVYVREVVPGQSLNIKHTTFCRLAPMEKPMFGNVKIVNRAFFVPFRTVFPFYNDFIADTTSNYNGSTIKVERVPTIGMYQLSRLFAAGDNFGFAERTQEDAYDFASAYGSTGYEHYVYTRKGRIFMTILNSLGISVDFSVINDSDSDNIQISALPLLCFAKIISDWYCNPQYTTRRDAINKIISKYYNGIAIADADALALANLIVYSLYDNDYFTAAFDNPVNPTSSAVSSYSIKDVTLDTINGNNGSVVRSGSTGTATNPSTPSIIGVNSSGTPTSYPFNLSQYVVDALKALTDFVKRHQLVGSQTLDRYMAQWGVQLDADKLNRSTYLGKSVQYVQVSDVMNNTESNVEGAPYLGNYAAKGVAYGDNGSYHLAAQKEFGVVIVVSTILPRISYVQGINRRNLHIDRLDFLNGDFDALGPQAIARAELYADIKSEDNITSKDGASYTLQGVFGYGPRYEEYAVANDWLSGDFRHNSMNADLECWHLSRMFNPVASDDYEELLKHSEDFSVGDPSQYNRIFQNSASSADHFYSVHHFDVVSYAPKKPLFEQYDFDDGRSQIMNLGGTKLN